jgi:hypothetical protein
MAKVFALVAIGYMALCASVVTAQIDLSHSPEAMAAAAVETAATAAALQKAIAQASAPVTAPKAAPAPVMAAPHWAGAHTYTSHLPSSSSSCRCLHAPDVHCRQLFNTQVHPVLVLHKCNPFAYTLLYQDFFWSMILISPLEASAPVAAPRPPLPQSRSLPTGQVLTLKTPTCNVHLCLLMEMKFFAVEYRLFFCKVQPIFFLFCVNDIRFVSKASAPVTAPKADPAPVMAAPHWAGAHTYTPLLT